MGRRVGLEGSVREHPPGSGRWRARLPTRLDPHRRHIDGVFGNERECRRALNQTIADLDAGRRAAPQTPPTAGAPARRLRLVIEEYIEARRGDPFDPIAINTVRDYTEVLRNVICRPHADLGASPARQLDAHAIDLWFRRLREDGVSHRRAAKALAVTRAALAWEVRAGRLNTNPAREVRRASTKKGRSSRVTADPVLLPSWEELATLASHPTRWEDRLLILVIAWAGLRWSEAISLSVSDVWADRPRLSVRRIFAWNAADHRWETEEVKGGVAATVPLPRPLWDALRQLAASRTVEERLGGDLLFRPTRLGHGRHPTLVVDGTNWRRSIWYPARAAAGLTGNAALSTLDPRHRGLKVKDLRAYAASVVVDAGGTQYEAAALLRHATVHTTNQYYARAQDERSHDPARARLRLDMSLTLPERIDALWTKWVSTYPALTSNLLSPCRV